MKAYERYNRFEHAVRALDNSSLEGAQVRAAREALARATDELSNAEQARDRAQKELEASSARVRDGTKKARVECRKGRGLLVGHGVPLEAGVVDDGGSPRAVLTRATYFLLRAEVSKVTLAALEASSDELRAAVAARRTARSTRDDAGRARAQARRRWDAVYSELRAAVEAQLRHDGLRGDPLQTRLEEYFPPRVERRAKAEEPAAAPPVEKPAA